MTLHWLDGFAMYDPDSGKVIGYCWRSLLSARWWTWQAELKWKRMVCRVLGHRYHVHIAPVSLRVSSCCDRCDWYDSTLDPKPFVPNGICNDPTVPLDRW